MYKEYWEYFFNANEKKYGDDFIGVKLRRATALAYMRERAEKRWDESKSLDWKHFDSVACSTIDGMVMHYYLEPYYGKLIRASERVGEAQNNADGKKVLKELIGFDAEWAMMVSRPYALYIRLDKKSIKKLAKHYNQKNPSAIRGYYLHNRHKGARVGLGLWRINKNKDIGDLINRNDNLKNIETEEHEMQHAHNSIMGVSKQLDEMVARFNYINLKHFKSHTEKDRGLLESVYKKKMGLLKFEAFFDACKKQDKVKKILKNDFKRKVFTQLLGEFRNIYYPSHFIEKLATRVDVITS